MYQVIVMMGENEPWWFFDDWQEDIQLEQTFASFEEACYFYEAQLKELRKSYTYIHAKKNYLCAFWNPDDKIWCEDCDEDLQNYQGLALLQNYQPLTVTSRKELYETTNSSGEAKRCQRS